MKKSIPDRQCTGEFREAAVSRLRQEVARLKVEKEILKNCLRWRPRHMWVETRSYFYTEAARRQAIEPIIGHLKADHRMNRCHLKVQTGNAMHAVLCAAGYNIRWLPRMIRKKGISLFLSLLQTLGLAMYIRVIKSSTTIKALFSFKTKTARAFA